MDFHERVHFNKQWFLDPVPAGLRVDQLVEEAFSEKVILDPELVVKHLASLRDD